MEVSESVAEKYKSQAAASDLRLLIQGLQMVNECDTQFRASKHQRLLVELTLMKLASILYNREGEKKKFQLKPFRGTSPILGSKSAAGIAIPKPNSPAKPSQQAAEKATPAAQKETTLTTSSVDKAVSPGLGKRNLILQSSESVSIKSVIAKRSAQQQQVAEQMEEIAQEQPTREYTTAELREAWSRFADEKMSHNMQAQSAFKVAEVELRLGNTLRVALPSVTQEMYFNEYRNQLAEFLRNTFDIRGIDFKVEIMRPEEIKSTYQSAKQRFDTLAAINPSLDQLRKRFNLQIDF
jgi:DNA polymerase-3 subunit gamma/tau